MPVDNTVTVTGSAGPGLAVTALALTGVRQLNFDFEGQTFEVVQELGTKQFQFSNIDTVTFSIPVAGGNVAVTITT
jgi:hypothetical protein